MLADIRIVEDENTGVVQVSYVAYDESGEVLSTSLISEHTSLEGAYDMLDTCYKATLKPSLIRLTNGSYE